MPIFKNFKGIDNVQPSERLVPDRDGQTPLAQATNVDILNDGALRRRTGYTRITDIHHEHLWQAAGFMLAVDAAGDLKAFTPGGTYTTVYQSLGCTPRVWYCNLPDGRTVFSNGLLSGVTDGSLSTGWGTPMPVATAFATSTGAGQLPQGDYRYQLTYTRLIDGQEGGACFAAPITLNGGINLSDIPIPVGHRVNVYLSGTNGDATFLAGTTTSSTFVFDGPLTALTVPCRTTNLSRPPVGKMMAFWRGRVLTAVGNVLYASRPGMHELFDIERDYKQFERNITMIQPTEGGVFVGTTNELAFLSGNEFDKLVYSNKINGLAVPGSNVKIPGEFLTPAVGNSCIMCIADKNLILGKPDGSIARVGQLTYSTSVTEVYATFRINAGVPQYIAIPV